MLEWQANLDPEARVNIVVAFSWIFSFLMQRKQSSFGVRLQSRNCSRLGEGDRLFMTWEENWPQRKSKLGSNSWVNVTIAIFFPFSIFFEFHSSINMFCHPWTQSMWSRSEWSFHSTLPITVINPNTEPMTLAGPCEGLPYPLETSLHGG